MPCELGLGWFGVVFLFYTVSFDIDSFFNYDLSVMRFTVFCYYFSIKILLKVWNIVFIWEPEFLQWIISIIDTCLFFSIPAN